MKGEESTTLIQQWDFYPKSNSYMVSSDGKVMSVDRMVKSFRNGKEVFSLRKGKEIKSHTDKNGYKTVPMCFDGVEKTCKVHRLVAETFIPNPGNKPQVNHKDGNKSNNLVSNLEWVNNSENQIHASKCGLMKTGASHIKAKRIVHLETGNVYGTIQEAADNFKINRSTFKSKLRRGKSKDFMYESDYIINKQQYYGEA